MAFDSIAQGLFLLISEPFTDFPRISIRMDILGGPWAPSGGPGGFSGYFHALDLIARGATGASGRVCERHWGSWKTLGRPLASGGPQVF